MIFFKVQISTNYENIILKFVVLSIGLARSGVILVVAREITLIIKGIKTYNFRIKSRICISSLRCETYN